MNESEQEA